MSHTINMNAFDVQYITIGISNFQHFVPSTIYVSSSGKACMVKSIFISSAGT